MVKSWKLANMMETDNEMLESTKSIIKDSDNSSNENFENGDIYEEEVMGSTH